MQHRAQLSLRKDLPSALLFFGVTCTILVAVSAAGRDDLNAGRDSGSAFSVERQQSSILHRPPVTPKAPLQTASKSDNRKGKSDDLKGQNDARPLVRGWTQEL
jgi:hypothetical protein